MKKHHRVGTPRKFGKSFRSRPHGFTLLEVLIALSLLSGTLVVALALQSSMAQTALRLREELRTSAFLQDVRTGFLLERRRPPEEGSLDGEFTGFDYKIAAEELPVPGFRLLLVYMWPSEDETPRTRYIKMAIPVSTN